MIGYIKIYDGNNYLTTTDNENNNSLLLNTKMCGDIYYIPDAKIANYNVLIGSKTFYDQKT